jgi:hypothetical protein
VQLVGVGYTHGLDHSIDRDISRWKAIGYFAEFGIFSGANDQAIVVVQYLNIAASAQGMEGVQNFV